MATTQAFVRLLRDLMRDKEIGHRIVPIAPDEFRTFGMDSMFPTAKIYNPHGQTYESVDRKLLLSYKESEKGQLLHEGISEIGAMGSVIAAGSAYAMHGEPMIPFYIFYSMFGFQRSGDWIWAMADQLARGFLLGATAGHHTHRRRLAARGWPLTVARQHQPGSRPLRPGLRVRDRPHCERRAAAHVRPRRPGPPGRRGRHLLHHDVQRACCPAGCSREP